MHKTLAFVSGAAVAFVGYLALSDQLVFRVYSFLFFFIVEQPYSQWDPVYDPESNVFTIRLDIERDFIVGGRVTSLQRLYGNNSANNSHILERKIWSWITNSALFCLSIEYSVAFFHLDKPFDEKVGNAVESYSRKTRGKERERRGY